MMELSAAEFDRVVAAAMDRVPERLAEVTDNVVVLVEDSDPQDAGLLGLYDGVALTERGHDYAGVLPDRITIYRRPHLSACSTEAELVDEVTTTVVHEIAHHFGIDDDRLHDLGWG